MPRKRILVVDDEKSAREILDMYLTNAGYHVTTAASGEAALTLALKKRFDLILSDFAMTGMNGLEFLKEVRARDPYIAFIMLTAHGSIDGVKQALRLGAHDYLEKPFEHKELLETIKRGLINKSVFVVHGHDEGVKESVARFLEKLRLRPIILHEQPSKGRTIIEKFEHYSKTSFVVVLLTPDDVCAVNGKRGNMKARARQNVIFELGYFLGRMGRERVCALYKDEVQLPTDYQGVIYIPIDEDGAWRLLLAKEIKHAGIEVDLNSAI